MSSAVRKAASATVLIGLLGLGTVFSQRPETPVPVVRAQAASDSQTIGMAGCAATGCHGRPDATPGILPPDVWHESFTRWIDRDPHTRAYAVLESKLAEQISKRLHEGDKSIPKDSTRDYRCLACHSNPALSTEALVNKDAAADPLNRLRAEGVSCESCHGNAEKWQIVHTNWTNPATRATDLQTHGMLDLNDWSVQAKTCAGCHIGAPANDKLGYPVRDMNHDMIAAGHPRLEFDFAQFHMKLSKHWNPKHRGTSPDPGRDAMLHGWLLGQIAVEEAYCELSEDRIRRGTANESRRPFPEFADWNCSQCHHNLTPAPWREEIVKAQTGKLRKLGKPIWIGASAVLKLEAIPHHGDPTKTQLADLEKRKQELVKLRGSVANLPKAEVRKTLESWLNGPATKSMNWEEANRAYLAFHSLDLSMPAPFPQVVEPLAQMRLAMWGSKDELNRREYTDKNDPGYKGYQRKPDSRWIWEKPTGKRTPVEETVAKLRELFKDELQKLPE